MLYLYICGLWPPALECCVAGDKHDSSSEALAGLGGKLGQWPEKAAQTTATSMPSGPDKEKRDQTMRKQWHHVSGGLFYECVHACIQH